MGFVGSGFVPTIMRSVIEGGGAVLCAPSCWRCKADGEGMRSLVKGVERWVAEGAMLVWMRRACGASVVVVRDSRLILFGAGLNEPPSYWEQAYWSYEHGPPDADEPRLCRFAVRHLTCPE